MATSLSPASCHAPGRSSCRHGGGGRRGRCAQRNLERAVGWGRSGGQPNGRRGNRRAIRPAPGAGVGVLRARRRPVGAARGVVRPALSGPLRKDAIHRRDRGADRAVIRIGDGPHAHRSRRERCSHSGIESSRRRGVAGSPGRAGRVAGRGTVSADPHRGVSGTGADPEKAGAAGTGVPEMIPLPPRPDRSGNGTAQPERPGASRWHRLHPLSPVVRTGRALYALLILLATAISSGGGGGSRARFFGDLAVAAALVAGGVISWLVTRWRLEHGTLRIETGLIRRNSQRLPLVQIQAIDTVRPFLARMFGLAELRLRMAGHAGSSGRLAYLTEREADLLRARLLALAHGIAEHTPEPPQRVLLSVPTGRLIGSILLSPFGLGVTVFVAILVSM